MKFFLEIQPAFDKRDPDPKKNYGIHGVNLRWVLNGKLGAVQFLLYTNWQLPHVQREFATDAKISKYLIAPLPADLGYHSLIPQYSGQQPMGSTLIDFTDMEEVGEEGNTVKMPKMKPTDSYTPCQYLNGEPCFYDGSGLNAERVFGILCEKGEEGLKAELQDSYTYHLGYEPKFWKHLNVFYKEVGGMKDWFFIYRHINGFYEGSKEIFNSPWKAFINKLSKNIVVFYKRTKLKLRSINNSKIHAFNTILSSQHKGKRKNI